MRACATFVNGWCLGLTTLQSSASVLCLEKALEHCLENAELTQHVNCDKFRSYAVILENKFHVIQDRLGLKPYQLSSTWKMTDIFHLETA